MNAKIVPLRKADRTRESEKKWGKSVISLGFSIIPSLLFRAQQRLGLNPTQLVVLLQLADYWWDQNRKPYPSIDALSERIGLSPRQTRRYVTELQKAGLLNRVERHAAHRGRLSNAYDLTGLVEKLQKLEPEFREVKEMKRRVARPGGLRKA
jgi:DNA-binding MarR family transcriptional regulator